MQSDATDVVRDDDGRGDDRRDVDGVGTGKAGEGFVVHLLRLGVVRCVCVCV